MATKQLRIPIVMPSMTASQWTEKNPTLLEGEWGWESDTNKVKIGNGSSSWINLPYQEQDLSAYAKTNQIPTDISELTDTEGMLGSTYNADDGITLDGTTFKLSPATKTSLGKADTALQEDDLDGLATETHVDDAISGATFDASKITSGVFDIDRIPSQAIERLHIVADATARLSLTNSVVQNGDTVKEELTGFMYFVVDDTKLDSEDGYMAYTAGQASSVPWSGVTGKPNLVEQSTKVSSGAGLTGGGDLSADRTLSVDDEYIYDLMEQYEYIGGRTFT